MAIAAICTMNNTHQEDSNSSSTSNNNNEDNNSNNNPHPQPQPQPPPDDDRHEHDVVMPGFRFHPTEEELVEFYLRRKIEGKRFNVELITFLDLYRYDPWELPALAAIGEKEWYFYVPRDKKYRNGDRPNRVTTSGYWKATGADRMIRNENSRSIGLKKTLVFYSGKAPKGIRTSWIMNEYRLPIQETERIQKTEISLCRVYKRAGVVDHPSLPRSLPIRGASSSKPSKIAQTARNQPETSNQQHLDRLIHATYGGGASQQNEGRIGETSQSSTTADRAVAVNPLSHLIDDDHAMKFLQSKHPSNSSLSQNCSTIFPGSSTSNTIDDLQKLVNIIAYQQQDSSVANNHETPQFSNNVVIPINLVSHFSTLHPHPHLHTQGGALIPGSSTAPLPDRLWDWNVIPEGSKDYTSLFK